MRRRRRGKDDFDFTGDLDVTKPPPPRQVHRLTCVLQLHHQVHGRDGTSFVNRFADLLDSGEDAYSRRAQVPIDVTPIDLAWCRDSPRWMAIENRAGLDVLTQPTEEENELYRSQLIFFGPKENPDAFFVPPQGRVNFVAIGPNTQLHWSATQGPVEARIFVCSA